MARGRNTALRSVTGEVYVEPRVRGLGECRGHFWAPAVEEPEELSGCPLWPPQLKEYYRVLMARWDLRSTLLVAVSLAVLFGLLGGLALEAGRPYPGFFVTPDYYVVPIESAARAAGLRA